MDSVYSISAWILPGWHDESSRLFGWGSSTVSHDITSPAMCTSTEHKLSVATAFSRACLSHHINSQYESPCFLLDLGCVSIIFILRLSLGMMKYAEQSWWSLMLGSLEFSFLYWIQFLEKEDWSFGPLCSSIQQRVCWPSHSGHPLGQPY